jgi:hypothetical protein
MSEYICIPVPLQMMHIKRGGATFTWGIIIITFFFNKLKLGRRKVEKKIIQIGDEKCILLEKVFPPP